MAQVPERQSRETFAQWYEQMVEEASTRLMWSHRSHEMKESESVIRALHNEVSGMAIAVKIAGFDANAFQRQFGFRAAVKYGQIYGRWEIAHMLMGIYGEQEIFTA